MDTGILIIDLLKLMAGMGVFLMACEIMSKNLEAISSDKLKKLFANVSGNKLIGVLIGALSTIAIHSSGATTVMTIGFVNAGIITLSQAATIIFGAEIGTTITGQIVALGMFNTGSIDMNVVLSALAGVGVFMNMFARNDKQKLIGYILTALGMLFAGLNMMSVSMHNFAQAEGLRIFLSTIDSIVLLVILGAVLTALIQSSSAITSIAITMVTAGLINIEQGIYLTLGANVGTCLTGVLAGTKSESTNAKRASLIQLIFNIGGVILVMISDLLLKLFSGGTISYALMFQQMFPGIPHTQLAMFHTIFNIVSVLLVLPFSDKLVDLTKHFIPEGQDEEKEERFYYVDENMLATPAVAVQQVKKEIINMADISMNNFNMAVDMVKNMDFSKLPVFQKNEKELNFLNHNLVELIVKLTGRENISRKDHVYLTSTYKTISDLERIGDYAENITEYASNLKENNETFSAEALKEVDEMQELINHLYDLSIDIYQTHSSKNLKEALKVEEKVDKLSKKMNDHHIKRLNEGSCSASVGAQYLKLASDAERIGDHLININVKDYVISH